MTRLRARVDRGVHLGSERSGLGWGSGEGAKVCLKKRSEIKIALPAKENNVVP